jgi:hypothetical protein
MKTIGDTCNTGNTTVLFLNKLVATLPWLLLIYLHVILLGLKIVNKIHNAWSSTKYNPF